MTKLRQLAQFSLAVQLNAHPVEQYVTALGAAACVVVTLYVDDFAPLGYQVVSLTGEAQSAILPSLPAGHWSQPRTSYDRQHQWGVVKKTGGWRAQTRVDDWARQLTMAEKVALAEAHALNVLPPAIIGLAYSQPLFEVMLDERWILREVGVACADRAADHDYTIHPIRLFHPAVDEALRTPALDSVTMRQPTAPIRHQNLFIMTDLIVPPVVTLWQVNDA